MKKFGLMAIGVIVAVAALILFSSMFIVYQTEQAIVLRFGNPVRVEVTPGLKFKVPMVENVITYDNRILPLDPPVQQVPLADQKRINVDAFARYKITEPLKLFQTVRTELGLRDRFGSILNAQVRDQVARSELTDLLGENRNAVMEAITREVSKAAPDFGIEVIDVRIGRSDLPTETSQSVFNRMRSERIAQAAKLRAEGSEIKARIEAEADRERTVIHAEARRKAEVLRGQGDAMRNTILGKAYGKDVEFFRFFRSLEAYRESMANGTSTMVLSPDSDFFRYFGNSTQPLP